MGNVGNPGAALEMGEAQAAAAKVGLEVILLEMRRSNDILPAFAALDGRRDALYLWMRSRMPIESPSTSWRPPPTCPPCSGPGTMWKPGG
jgi:hypothetical protein